MTARDWLLDDSPASRTQASLGRAFLHGAQGGADHDHVAEVVHAHGENILGVEPLWHRFYPVPRTED